MLEVTWHINAGQELYSASKILDGLSALRRKGALRLRFVPNTSCPTIADKLVLLTLRGANQAPTRKVIIDLWDTSEFRCSPALNYADVYFKRCLLRAPIESIADHLQPRIRPFGLNFACVDSASWADWLAASIARARAAAPANSKAAVSGLISDLRLFTSIPSHNYFVANPGASKRPIAVFQSRVWPANEFSDGFEQLNQQRVDLVMFLRDALGQRFVGGIVESAFARTRYPKAIVSDSTHRRAYATLIRSALVGVYSRGIDGSLAFKLSEYLAAGCCMVIEPFAHVLDIPLEPGVHYLSFTSAESCAAACMRLLDDGSIAAEMSCRNAEYFRRYLTPERHIARVLSTALQEP
jgi:hypothetical protein